MSDFNKVVGLTCLVLLSTSLPCMAALNLQFTKIDFPGAVKTTPYGINNRNMIVGEYVAVDGSSHGFLWIRGVFTPLDFPGAGYTSAKGINDAGAVVGDFKVDPSGKRHGFLYVGGSFSQIDFPDSTMTNARAILLRGRILFGRTFHNSDKWLRPVVRMAVATAMRRSEIVGPRWLDVDLARGGILLPQTKNGEGRIVCLNKYLSSISVLSFPCPPTPGPQSGLFRA